MQSVKIQHIFIYTPMLCLMAFLMFPLTAPAQNVTIPDANLRAAIAETLGKEPNSQITRADMRRLTRLDAHNSDITDLTGLEFATNLNEIRANDNLIEDLSPLAELTQLNVIEFRHNVISDLSPLAGLINLNWLIVNDNLISDLSTLADLTHLHGLEISHNAISDFSPLAGLTKLENIWLSENPIADLSEFIGLTSLRRFQSWGTPVFNLSALTELPKLQVLDICGGDIFDISPLGDLTNLSELYLVGNEITDISPLANLTGLKRLSLEHNQVQDVSPLAALHNLTWIELSENEILDFSPLDALPKSVAIVKNNNPGFRRDPKKIDGPWLWMIVPTGRLPGSIAAASGRDFLSVASGQQTTEAQIATQGATEGDQVGDKVWTVGRLSRSGPNNINDMVNATGLGTDNIDFHVAYGSIALNAPSQQSTRLFIGSGDAVKVWLNGTMVHNKPVDRDSDGYQEDIPVTLKQGENILLVAVYEGDGWWSGFFGLESTDYTPYLPNPIVVPVGQQRVADVDSDGVVSILDMILVSRHLGRIKITQPQMDINNDGKINISDLILVARSMDTEAGAAPSALTPDISARVQAWIAQAEAADDGSLVFRQGIANLKRLLAALIPERTDLLANYPNPFNPETWIPYQLAKSAKVSVRIYDATGALVRTLALGHQTAGIYQEKSRAAYWDGKNELGESVASGIYFYMLIAGDFTATRKMLIRK
ncbi:T9SS type A sorting domain-containing protein [Candidatus Poribacteria bacterium]|nr:T9SS type A sorting domain-containing protein [Candidatus Poribacteria bacterium]MYA56253.1 T9SS type A sorting domain-containing protein [Candidatus Poribacteria bacterium]